MKIFKNLESQTPNDLDANKTSEAFYVYFIIF